jgi:hypothetical protein
MSDAVDRHPVRRGYRPPLAVRTRDGQPCAGVDQDAIGPRPDLLTPARLSEVLGDADRAAALLGPATAAAWLLAAALARTAAPTRVAVVRLAASASAPRAMPPSAPPVCAVRLFAETTVARVDGPTTARSASPGAPGWRRRGPPSWPGAHDLTPTVRARRGAPRRPRWPATQEARTEAIAGLLPWRLSAPSATLSSAAKARPRRTGRQERRESRAPVRTGTRHRSPRRTSRPGALSSRVRNEDSRRSGRVAASVGTSACSEARPRLRDLALAALMPAA